MFQFFFPSISKFAFIVCLTLLFPPPTLSLRSAINVWPKPRLILWPKPLATFISPNFTISFPNHQHLTPAVNRYLRLIQTEHHHPVVTPSVNISTSSPPLETLIINIIDLTTPLQHGVNETYALSISDVAATANLTAATPWGAIRGLETFSQLVWDDPSAVPVGLYVWDAPLFAHRGVLLDTSRNYYGVEDILRTIEAMSANKLNVFHWHITDSQSFPLMVPSEPELAAKGSYGPDMIYSPSDVTRIVQFGLEHGVRVLPEIDSPGHTGSWAEAYPEIVTCANMFWWPAGCQWADRLASEPGTGHLNPLNPKTYQVLKNIIRDVAILFPETFYHGGSDEIIPGCWKADPTIQSFLSDGGTLGQLLETFVNSTLPYILSLNRTAVYWEDVLLDDNVKVDSSFLPREHTILQTWNNGSNNTKKIVEAGYRAIVSSSEFYYLDCGHGGFVGNDTQYDQQSTGGNSGNGGSWCAPFKTWQTIYNYDITYGLSEDEAKLVLGGEVALWSEQADPTVLDTRIWPRTSAMAETLWSGNRDGTGKKRYAEATDRLNEWRYRMAWECTSGKEMAWNILSLFTTSGMLFLEVSLVAFLLQGNYASGLEALTRTFIVSGLIVGLDLLLKAIYLFGFGVPLFIDNTEHPHQVKWGLWVIHRLVLTAIYSVILFMYHSKWRERLPARPAFYKYVAFMFILNALELFACGLTGNGAGFGFWLYSITVVCYHALYLPLLYITFLADFFQEEDLLLENVYYSEMKDAGFFDAGWE